MLPVSLTLDPAFRVGPVRRRTFGSFVEHLGWCVYTDIHDPGHPTADEDGLRGDAIDLTRELGISTVRCPGGKFVSGYRWEDGIGPRADPDHTWTATVDDATSVLPRHNSTAALVDGRLTVQVPPVSWNVVRLGG